MNMDAILRMSEVIKETARLTSDRDSIGCAKLVIFCNMVEDNPFMAGAMHGSGEADAVVHVGISGPGVIRSVVEGMPVSARLNEVAEAIKSASFKITRMGELVAREAARRLNVSMGIVDLSLAPTPAEGDSVAAIIEAIGVDKCGHCSTTPSRKAAPWAPAPSAAYPAHLSPFQRMPIWYAPSPPAHLRSKNWRP
jgi:uncharacterized protein (UPF0210 family)